MANGIKLIPLSGINTDVGNQYMKADLARYVKNLYYQLTDNAQAASADGSQLGVLKPLQANAVYCPIALPAGENYAIGTLPVRATNELYVWVHNGDGNHCIFRINGDRQTCTIVKVDPCFDFKLDPRYFIHEGGAVLDLVTLIDPDTGDTLIKKDLTWTNGTDYMGYLRVDDCIDTNGFDPVTFPYFDGVYDKCSILRMGLPTPKSCIKVEEIPIPELYEVIKTGIVPCSSQPPNVLYIDASFGALPKFGDIITIPAGNPLSGTYNVLSAALVGGNVFNPTQRYRVVVQEPMVLITALQVSVTLSRRIDNQGANNNLLYETWQFRIKDTDVFGRVSEYGIICDTYVPGINDCISAGSNLPTCVNLKFDAGNPFINTKEIAWRNCNDEVWHTETVLFLWQGSNIGQWWLRVRNPEINYDYVTNEITYKFCRDKQCDPIDVLETNRLQPPLPKSCQSLFKLNKSTATANNKDGFNPFSQELLDKITVKITPPDETNPDTRKITIYVAIGEMNQQVSKRDNKYVYGGMDSFSGGGIALDLVNSKKQFFINKDQSGFAGYLVNGSTAISTQVYIDAAGQLIDDVNFDAYNLSPSHRSLQKFEFLNVPKGSYIFRIASPTVDPVADKNYRETSVPIWALCPFDKQNNYQLDFNNRTQFPACELYIDVCNGDYDTLTDNRMLVIANMAFPFLFSQCGYFKESITNDTVWELLKVFNGQDGAVSSIRTDANGFYWLYKIGTADGATPYLNVATYSTCRRIDKAVQLNLVSFDMYFQDYYMATFFDNPGAEFKTGVCNYVEIKGRLLLQGTFVAVSNAVVMLTRGGSAVTDDDGYFVLIAHDDASNENPYGLREDKLIISGGACTYNYLIPDGCLPVINISIVSCSITSPNQCPQRTLLVGTFNLIYNVFRGLLSGGTYVPYVNGYDWLGRKTYSQPLKQFTIPTIIESKAIAPSKVEILIDPTAIFPDEIEYIVFSITEETTIEKYLSWIVDRAEYIDAVGAIVDMKQPNANPSQIRIYYQSVIEFNAVNNYNTTTDWNFLIPEVNTPVLTDKVQFYINGDGKFFTKNITSLIKYEQSGASFTIDYTSDLYPLLPNALMRLWRPKNCIGNEPNFEVCSPVDIINGEAQQNTILLNAWDTYYLSRQIPVPAPLTPTPTVDQIATVVGNVTTYETPVPVPTILELRNVGFRFEHDNPSNFWGKGCKNLGRVNSKNPYEAELIHENQIAFGGSVSINGQLNYTQYFSETQKYDLSIPNTGGIICVIPKQGILLILTQFNNLTLGFGDNIARIDGNGNIVAPSGANTFGNPNVKVSGNYGCQVWDKNTIRERDGLVHFLDTSRVAILQHNFNDCQDISSNKTNPNRKSTILSWLAKKLISVRENNLTDNAKRYFLSVINPANNEYIISDFTLRGTSYVNEERDYAYDKQETMAYDIKADVWKGAYSSTPECWGYLESELVGNQLFAFKNGVPYFYYSATNTVYNTFFGVKCNRVYEFVIAEEMMRKYKPLWLEVYCKQSGYFADRILTETGQLSRILIPYWKQGEFMFSAPFLRDLNTLTDPNNPQQVTDNPIVDGNVLYGTWCKVRLVGYPDKDDVYSQLEGCQVFILAESNTGLR